MTAFHMGPQTRCDAGPERLRPDWRRFPPADAGRHPGSPRRCRRSGLTLVEVMIAFMVLGTTALATLSALLFAYRTADANLRAISALAAARSVIEQIRALDATALMFTTIPVDIPSSPVGTLTVDAWNERVEDVHNTPADADDDMTVEIRPEMVTGVSVDGIQCTQVIVRYRWDERVFFQTRLRERALTVVVAPISSY